MSSTERQQRFRQNNPGYDARRKATRRASEKRAAERMIAAMQAAHAESVAVAERGPLLLPAPVEPLVFPWTIASDVRREAVPA